MGKSFLVSSTTKVTWKKFGSPEINLGWWDLKFKKGPMLKGKWGKNFKQKKAKWPKITFLGPRFKVPKVSCLGVSEASLYWKVVLEFWFRHSKCDYWYPQNGPRGVILSTDNIKFCVSCIWHLDRKVCQLHFVPWYRKGSLSELVEVGAISNWYHASNFKFQMSQISVQCFKGRCIVSEKWGLSWNHR